MCLITNQNLLSLLDQWIELWVRALIHIHSSNQCRYYNDLLIRPPIPHFWTVTSLSRWIRSCTVRICWKPVPFPTHSRRWTSGILPTSICDFLVHALKDDSSVRGCRPHCPPPPLWPFLRHRWTHDPRTRRPLMSKFILYTTSEGIYVSLEV